MTTLLITIPSSPFMRRRPAIPSGRTACAPSRRFWRIRCSGSPAARGRAGGARRHPARAPRGLSAVDRSQGSRAGRHGGARPRHLDERGKPRGGLSGGRAGIAAVDAVVGGDADNAFCAVRPPGHHAETSRAMGFCLFSSIAIAAHHAMARHGLERVAVIDFDVHHGNGTQEIFWSKRDLLYGSTHQMPLFPGTGALRETGVGNIWNAPLRPAMERRGSARRWRADLSRPHRPPAGADPDLGWVRRAPQRPAGRARADGSRFRLGDAQAHGHCRPGGRRAGGVHARRRL